jgi:hypothetical protein
MKIRLTLRNVGIVLSGAVLVGLSLSGTAKAITDTIFKYTAAKTGYLPIPVSAFSPNNLNNNYGNDSQAITALTNNPTCFVAPVNLPHGATMTAWSLMEKSGAGEFQAGIRNSGFGAGAVGGLILYKPTLPDTGGLFKQFNFPISEVIDNVHHNYSVFFCLISNSAAFAGMRVTYTYTNAGS